MGNIFGKEKLVYEILEELDKRLAQMGVRPFELNVISGFALVLGAIRCFDYIDYKSRGFSRHKTTDGIADGTVRLYLSGCDEQVLRPRL